MKNELKTHHLRVYGRKIELIERLVKFRANIRECRVVIQRLKPEEIPFSTNTIAVPNQMVTRSAKRRAVSYQRPAHEAREIAPVDTVSIANQMVTKGAKRRAISYQKPAHEARTIAPINAKKKQKKNRKRAPKKNSVVSIQPSLRPNEMVWSYVRGFPWWPGIVESETVDGKYTIHFFGDYSRYDVHKKNIKHFMEGFLQYAEVTKTSKLLYKAAEEAKIFLYSNRPTRCYICQMLDIKRTLLAK